MMCHQNSSFLGKFLRYSIVINMIDNLRINSCQRIIHKIKISIRIERPCKIYSGPLATTENRFKNDGYLKMISANQITRKKENLPKCNTLFTNKGLISTWKILKIRNKRTSLNNSIIKFFLIFTSNQNIFSNSSAKNPSFLRNKSDFVWNNFRTFDQAYPNRFYVNGPVRV